MSDGLSDYWRARMQAEAVGRGVVSRELAWPTVDYTPIVPRRDDIWNHTPPYFWLGREAE